MKKTLIATAVGLALTGAGVANAALVTGVFGNGTWDTNFANFTMLQPNGAMQGGTNDVVMHWDGNAFNNISDYTGLTSVSNVTAASSTTFSSNLWTAHNIQVFTPGSYVFDTAIGGGNLESGNLTMNVGPSQLGMHMLFDWGGQFNIDVAVVANNNQAFGSGLSSHLHGGTCNSFTTNANCLWTSGPASSAPGGRPADGTLWMLASVDGNGDGVPGIPMAVGGPFGSFQANFNANMTFTPAVPVPAAAWLLGSGLLGLVGVARRKKA